jgi:MYXO-CTERM domain-containing protein
MKMRYALLLSWAIWASSVSARAQGSFQNLGFEAATLVPPAGSGTVQSAPAFPGWSLYIGGVQQTHALAVYNDLNLDASGIAIIDRGFTNPFGGPGGSIEDNYSAVLMGGVDGDTTLSQTGLVPGSARSLWFKARLVPLAGTLQVTLGGERLSFGIMGLGTNYMLFAADITSLAGQTAELDFTAIGTGPPTGERYAFLDAIQFSDQAIPEPAAVGLAALGALLVLRRRNQQR